MSISTSHRWTVPVDEDEVRSAWQADGWTFAVHCRRSPGDEPNDPDVRAADQIFVMLEGCACMNVGSWTQNLVAGDEAIIPKETPHKFFAVRGAARWLYARRCSSIPNQPPTIVVTQSPHYLIQPQVVTAAEPFIHTLPVAPSPQQILYPTMGVANVMATSSSHSPRPITQYATQQIIPTEHWNQEIEMWREQSNAPFHVCPNRIVKTIHTASATLPPALPYVEMERIKLGGDHNRDLLGAHLVIEQQGDEEKVIFKMITAGGPAHIAGVKLMDQIVSWDGVQVESFAHFQELIKYCHAGQVVQLGLLTPPGSTHPHRPLKHIRSVILSHDILPFDMPDGTDIYCPNLPKYQYPGH